MRFTGGNATKCYPYVASWCLMCDCVHSCARPHWSSLGTCHISWQSGWPLQSFLRQVSSSVLCAQNGSGNERNRSCLTYLEVKSQSHSEAKRFESVSHDLSLKWTTRQSSLANGAGQVACLTAEQRKANSSLSSTEFWTVQNVWKETNKQVKTTRFEPICHIDHRLHHLSPRNREQKNGYRRRNWRHEFSFICCWSSSSSDRAWLKACYYKTDIHPKGQKTVKLFLCLQKHWFFTAFGPKQFAETSQSEQKVLQTTSCSTIFKIEHYKMTIISHEPNHPNPPHTSSKEHPLPLQSPSCCPSRLRPQTITAIGFGYRNKGGNHGRMNNMGTV